MSFYDHGDWTDENVVLLRELDALCKKHMASYAIEAGDTEFDVTITELGEEPVHTRASTVLNIVLSNAVDHMRRLDASNSSS